MLADYKNIYDMFAKGGLKRRPTAPCFGTRFRPDGSVGPYAWQTYAEVSARIDNVGEKSFDMRKELDVKCPAIGLKSF